MRGIANYRVFSLPWFLARVVILAILIVNPYSVRANPEWTVVFSNDFEENNLLPFDGTLWSTIRQQAPCISGGSCLPNKQPSIVEQVTDKAHSGTKSLRCFSDGGDSTYVGKADIFKTNLSLRLGETYRLSTWFWLPTNSYLKTITLMDIECTAGSGPNDCEVAKTAGPRLWVVDRRDSGPPRLQFGRGKLGEEGVKGERPIPLGQWFKLTVEMTLGSGSSGHTRVWINDELDIDFIGTNIQPSSMPELNHYNFFQVGLTANATGTTPGEYSALSIYVDDVLIEQQTQPQPVITDVIPPDSPTGVKVEQGF